MKKRLKLWLKRKALMALRAIVWRVDGWIQRKELELRPHPNELTERVSAAGCTSVHIIPGRNNGSSESPLRGVYGSAAPSPIFRRETRNDERQIGNTDDARRAAQLVHCPAAGASALAAHAAALAADRDPATAGPAAVNDVRRDPLIAPKMAARGSQSSARPPKSRFERAPEKESFDQWTLRRASVAPASKAEAKRHRERISAQRFDLRFAR